MSEKSQQFHFIGIGGIGMSGLARILLSKQISVSGSDMASSYVTEGLVKKGAKVHLGHSDQHVAPQAIVVYSSDIKENNPEFIAAKEKKCQMMHRSDLLAFLMKDYQTLAVTGTHGKTTTSSLLTWVLKHSNLDPSYAIGGVIPQLASNAGHGQGKYFVAEADESDGTFLKYHSEGAIVTNIDSDHINHFGNMQNLIQAFQQFLGQVKNPELLFWCGDDEYLQKLQPVGISYGFGKHCQLRISNFLQKGWQISFDIHYEDQEYKNLELPLVGNHNALNAAAVFGLALNIGLSENEIRQAFHTFGGVHRRCEKKGEIHHILLLDDYAHHPTEIQTTLQAIRQGIHGRRLIVVFQPHRYTRIKECLGSFKDVFDAADELFVTDLYAAGEVAISGVTTEAVIKDIQRRKKCHYVPRTELAETLSNVVRSHDVVVTLGAGDITKLSSELLLILEKKPPKKWKVGVVFGGRSTEHEISLLSTAHVLNCLSQEIYDVQQFGITKQGYWICGDESLKRLQNREEISTTPVIESHVFQDLISCDLFVPILHGPYGEDGTIQGFFEMLDKPCVGPDHISAAISMDKAHTKYLMQAHHLSTLPFVEVQQERWRVEKDFLLDTVREQLNFPVFVKPVHLGSTVGIFKVNDISQLSSAIEEAFLYDYKLIVENGLVNFREIEFAVLGNERAIVFPPGEVFSAGNVYDFEAKYGKEGMKALPIALLSAEKVKEGMNLALKAYHAVGGMGMARVDFFLDAHGKFWLNEINPIPGFTSISLYPKICEINGLKGDELLDYLIIAAFERKRRNTILCRNR